jgi:hypothetical protein
VFHSDFNQDKGLALLFSPAAVLIVLVIQMEKYYKAIYE